MVTSRQALNEPEQKFGYLQASLEIKTPPANCLALPHTHKHTRVKSLEVIMKYFYLISLGRVDGNLMSKPSTEEHNER